MNPTDAIVRVDFFGQLHIETSYGQISGHEINSDQLCKFMAYLILNRKSVISADVLTAILWPQGIEDPYASLRGLACRAKKLLKHLFPDIPFIEAQCGSYAVNRQYKLIVDAEVLSDRIHAMSLQTRPSEYLESDTAFLDDHCAPFLENLASDIWGLPVSTYYNAKLLYFLTAVLKRLFAEKRYEDVIAYAARGLTVDPLSEQLHGMIILALLGQGNRKLAIDHYNHTVKMFEQEYNITPTGSFLDLNRQLSHPELHNEVERYV